MNYLSSILSDLIGRYTPVTYIVDEFEYVASGAAGVDWPWIASAVLLIVCVYSIFRIVRCVVAR